MKRTKDEHIAFLTSLLDEELPTNDKSMKDALIEAHKAYADIIRLRVKAQTNLYNKRLQYLHPKEKDYTDMDRKIMLEAHTSQAQADYELLAGLEKTLEQRIEVISLLIRQV